MECMLIGSLFLLRLVHFSFILQKAEEQMAMIKYRCEVAEKKRMREAQEQFRQEKAEALQQAAEQARKDKEQALKDNTEYVTRTTRSICAVEKEQAIAESLKNARVCVARGYPHQSTYPPVCRQ